MTRMFVNLPTLSDREAVVAECERIGALRVGGYRAHDGLRCMVEMPVGSLQREKEKIDAIDD